MADEQIKVVTVYTPTEGAAEQVREILTELTAKSRTEPGCASYELYESTVLAGTFVTIEAWVDAAAQEGHTRGLPMKFAASALRPHLAVLPVLHPLAPIPVER